MIEADSAASTAVEDALAAVSGGLLAVRPGARAGRLPPVRAQGPPVDEVVEAVRAEVVAALRHAGARFGLLHGSRAAGTARPDSDVDVAAWWGADAPPSFEVDLPPGVDLLVLDGGPLEIVGRIAQHGVLLFDDDPAARVRWVATTRKIYLDELPRLERSRREFLDAMRRRG